MTTTTAKKTWMLPFIMVLFTHFSYLIANYGFAPIIALIQEDLSLTTQQAATLGGLNGLMAIIIVIPASFVIQKFGGRKTATICLVLQIVGSFVMLISQNYMTLLVGRIIWCMFYRIAMVSVMGLTISVVPKIMKGRATGFNGTAAGLGSAVGAQIAVLGITLFGGFRGAFYIFIAFAVLGALAVGLFAKSYTGPEEMDDGETAKEVAAAKAAEKLRGATPLKPAWKSPGVWALVLLMFFVSVTGPVLMMNSLIIKEQFGGTVVATANIQSIGTLCGLFIVPFMGWVCDKFGCWKSIYFSVVLVIISLVLMTVSSFPLFCIGAGMAAFLAFAPCNMVYACAPTLIRDTDVGGGISIIAFGTGAALFLLPKLLAASFDMLGSFKPAIIGLAALAILGAVLAFLLSKHCEKRDNVSDCSVPNK